MIIFCITICIIALSALCAGKMLYQASHLVHEKLPGRMYFKLILSGITAFIADTFGVGSFAVNVALAKLLGTFHDDELPAMNNGAQVIPGTIESLYFMQSVQVDLTTLLTLVAGTCVGGLLGGAIVSRLSKQAIRLAMMCCFALLISLLLANQLHLLPIGGDKIALHSYSLVFGFLALTVCGALTSVGIGLFAMVQGVLFLMNVSPLIAFPIMMTAGAMQQPLTTMVFLHQKKIPLKKTLILSFSGCLGVFISIPLFKYLSASNLHWLLLGIVAYNLIAISRAYFKARPQQKHAVILPVAID